MVYRGYFILMVILIYLGLVVNFRPASFGARNSLMTLQNNLQTHVKSMQDFNEPRKSCVTNEKNQPVCMYSDICYNRNDDIWYMNEGSNDVTLNSATKNEPNLMNFKSKGNNPQIKTCSNKFHTFPRKEKAESSIIIPGTSYFLCCWNTQFGHVLVNMIFPAFNALSKLFPHELSSVQFIVHESTNKALKAERGDIPAYYGILEFFTGYQGKVFSFDKLVKNAAEEGKQEVCFERLAAGMFLDSVIWSASDPEYDIKENALEPMKDHLSQLYPLEQESLERSLSKTRLDGQSGKAECNISLLVRKGKTRNILNQDGVLDTIKMIFNDDMWNIQIIAFDDTSLESQYLTLQNTKIFLSVSGSGTHMAAFLPDGAVSVELGAMFSGSKVHSVNSQLCKVLPKLTCHICPPQNEDKITWKETRSINITVDNDELQRILMEVQEQANDQCLNSEKSH